MPKRVDSLERQSENTVNQQSENTVNYRLLAVQVTLDVVVGGVVERERGAVK
jgi:hypothetical protein